MFEPAIEEMEQNNSHIFGPCSFNKYIKVNNLPARGPAPYISIDSFNKLPNELKENNIMVFRLGSPQGEVHTHFALIKLKSDWNDFFLFDENIFSKNESEVFLPSVSIRQLFTFQLLPNLTETSIVNLAVSSGLLNNFLSLEINDIPAAPATGQSVFTFDFKPYPDMDNWQHNKGQVEIDALLVGKRQGKEHLFVIEAKVSNSFGSLAKHKLVYPVLAVSENVPKYIPIVPVYIRAIKERNAIHFYMAECSIPDPRDRVIAISELTVTNTKTLVLHGFN